MHDPYRRSVWLDVAGVVLLLTLLVAPVAYLAVEGAGSTGSFSSDGGPAVSDRGVTAPRSPNANRSMRPTRPRSGPEDVAGTGEAPTSAPAPFSAQWRTQAAPTLAGSDRTGSSGGGGFEAPSRNSGPNGAVAIEPSDRAGEVSVSGRSDEPASSPDAPPETGFRGGIGASSGPALAARGPSSAGGNGGGPSTRSTRGPEEDRSAADEAEQLAGQMRALSGELGQMQSRASAAEEQSQSGASAPDEPDAPDRRNPGSPSNVPIDDHLHWLAVLGILWGVWRIGRGA